MLRTQMQPEPPSGPPIVQSFACAADCPPLLMEIPSPRPVRDFISRDDTHVYIRPDAPPIGRQSEQRKPQPLTREEVFAQLRSCCFPITPLLKETGDGQISDVETEPPCVGELISEPGEGIFPGANVLALTVLPTTEPKRKRGRPRKVQNVEPSQVPSNVQFND